MPILLQSTFLKSEHPHWKNAPQEAVTGNMEIRTGKLCVGIELRMRE